MPLFSQFKKNDFSGQLFHIFEIIIFFLVVAICDLVCDVRIIHGLWKLLKVSGNLFLNMSDAHETAICSFKGIIHI